MPRSSVKRTLVQWLVSALVALSAVFIGITYVVERSGLEHRQDRRLERIALAVPPNLKSADLRSINVKLLHGRDDFLLQIWNGDSEIYQSHADLAAPRFSTLGFSVQPWRGERWKVYVRRTGANTIQVAQSLDERCALVRSRVLHTIVPLLLFLPVIILAMPLCVDQGLRSLRRLSDELRTRGPECPDPVSRGDEPSEVAPLVEALDTLFQRVRDASDAQRRFIADASHELRTPLATLQIQTQVVEQALGTTQERAALDALKAGIKRTGQLADQLLLASRLEAGEAGERFERLRLDELTREVILEMLPFASSKDIDLGLGRMDAAIVLGCRDQLHFLVRNLIDNAIRYTPAAGRIDIEVVDDGQATLLSVEDSGPGIPPEERERVFDRFYRCPGRDTPGSGLGLAIVKQVAGRHRALVRLGRSEGLEGLQAAVSFPSAGVAGPIAAPRSAPASPPDRSARSSRRRSRSAAAG